MRKITRLIAAAAGLAALAGCEQFGDPLEAIGAKRPAPDEFAVLARAPLVVPPDVRGGALPVPDPGRRSPLEPDPGREAAAALMGGNAVAGAAAGAPSRGEGVLLASANASASSEIRVQLEQDRIAAEQAEADGPYEPPSLVELFFGEDEENAVDPEIVLDPVAESQRLQRQGIAAPNDPLARPAEAGTAGGTSVGTGTAAEPFYPGTGGQRPQGPFAGQNTVPATE